MSSKEIMVESVEVKSKQDKVKASTIDKINKSTNDTIFAINERDDPSPIVNLHFKSATESSPVRRSKGVNSKASHYTISCKRRKRKFSPMMTPCGSSSRRSPSKFKTLSRTFMNFSQKSRKEYFFGRDSMNSKNINEPAFSFGSSKKNNLQIVNKVDMNEIRGKDSPGVGRYSFNNYSLSHSVMRERGFAKVSERRFEEQRIRVKNNKDTAHTLMPEQFPPIIDGTLRKRAGRKSISQEKTYSNLIYNNFTQGKQCNFTKAERFNVPCSFINNMGGNSIYIPTNDVPGPNNFEMLWAKYRYKKIKPKRNIQNKLKSMARVQ
ncbi:unnamed protein product [Moneuplotes crassus]|uniref:Uncharacterized protein n=1 Tax=Euplotes crassus TaxID=5936 RepID=A0AAD1UE07_EUPCR|nr:unnamed protein product [Moneuplotes crassus]